MKALSVRQPWAWLIIHAGKDIENRTWQTDYRGPLLIHASRLTDVRALASMSVSPAALDLGALIGLVDLVDVVRRHPSRWFDGPYGWVLRNPRPITPIPFRGALKLFEVSSSLIRIQPGSATPAAATIEKPAAGSRQVFAKIGGRCPSGWLASPQSWKRKQGLESRPSPCFCWRGEGRC